MLKSSDIKGAVFQTQMGGYKRDEVDVLLGQIYEDYKQFESVVSAHQAKIEALEKELEEKDISMSSINTVLISAQKLADDIVAQAQKKAEETVAAANVESENIKLRTKKALEEIDAVITEQKNKAQAQVDGMLQDAARKSEGMILAAKDSVTREQLLFDKLKSEVAEFKQQIKEAYKSHIESISKLPEEVVLSPELAASTIEEIINKEPDLLKFIEKTPLEEEKTAAETISEEIEEAVEEAFEEETEEADTVSVEETEAENSDDKVEKKESTSTGFVVNNITEDEDNDEDEGDDDAPAFSKGFFAKHK